MVGLDRLIAEAGLERLGLQPRIVDRAGSPATDVSSVTMDSRRIQPGALFACVPGTSFDGHDFAPMAVEAGAAALLCERPLEVDIPQLVVNRVRPALGPVADVVFGRPSAHLVVAGVTGTNGKTTTCAFLQAIFEANGWPATAIGTLTSARTTPEAPELNAQLAAFRDSGGRAVAMEVSSHALEQHRTAAVRFAGAAFTNLTPEHLDYHGSMEAYYRAKRQLFDPDQVGVAIVNTGDTWGTRLAAELSAAGFTGDRLVTWSRSDAAEVRLRPDGASFVWGGRPTEVRLGGLFNVDNALAAATTARALGVDDERIRDGLAGLTSVPGRFQLVDAGQNFSVVVDYAHTPDGLAQVLESARQLIVAGPTRGAHLLVVFGAGGERDRDKRPLMGRAAAERADLVIVTSDNPRGEDPGAIIAEVVAPLAGDDKVRVVPDRASAITTAIGVAQPGDVVVIAGKGHEQGQEIAGRTLPFDDVEVARGALTRVLGARAGRPDEGEGGGER